MRIYVVPRYWVEQKYERNPQILNLCSVISIYSTGDCSPILSNLQTVLKLQFDDITKPEPGLILFTDEMAEKIINFADYLIENFPERTLIVHCDAGVSRSGAVGSVLNDYINMKLCREDDRKLFWKKHRNLILPNGWVKARLMKTWRCNHNETKGRMTHENADEYHVTEAEFRKFLHDYPSRDEMEKIYGKYLPPNRQIDQFVKEAMYGQNENLPTAEQMDKLLHDVRAIQPDANLTYRYIYDETGARCIEVTDGKGFVLYMNEKLFKESEFYKMAKGDQR